MFYVERSKNCSKKNGLQWTIIGESFIVNKDSLTFDEIASNKGFKGLNMVKCSCFLTGSHLGIHLACLITRACCFFLKPKKIKNCVWVFYIVLDSFWSESKRSEKYSLKQSIKPLKSKQKINLMWFMTFFSSMIFFLYPVESTFFLLFCFFSRFFFIFQCLK